MNRQVIAVDIDDVLSTNVQEFLAYCNDRWGTQLTAEDYSEDWPGMWGVDEVEGRRRSDEYHNSGTMGRYGRREEALPVLKKLKETYKLIIVTSRQRVVLKETADWINAYFEGVFEEIHHAGIWDDYGPHSVHGTKAEICQQLGADFLIDDQPKHCIAAANAGITSLLFGEYPWNRHDNLPADVHRVRAWQEVLDYFNERSR